MRTAVILGTRPEAIKLAPLVRTARQRGWDVRVWWTGQHDEMVSDVLELFDISVDERLDALGSCRSVSETFAYVLRHADALIERWHPDLVLVQGDTTTAAAGGLAGFHRHCVVGHVEAGLRTYDLDAPFPEEANRQIVGRVAKLHFAPTAPAEAALRAEGVPASAITVTGNTGIDALFQGIELARRQLPDRESLVSRLHQAARSSPLPEPHDASPDHLVLVTAHRRENHGAPLASILTAIAEAARRHPTAWFVFPVHPNPNVTGPVHETLRAIPNVMLTPPLGYDTMCSLLREVTVVVTDSGGLQEEAVSVGVPVAVMRRTTERPEGVEAGLAQLVGHDGPRIGAAIDSLIQRGRGIPALVYGDGKASERIVEFAERSMR